MNIKIKKVKSVKDNSSIKKTVKKAEKKTGGSSLDIKIRRYSSAPKVKNKFVKAKGVNLRGDNNDSFSGGGGGEEGGEGAT